MKRNPFTKFLSLKKRYKALILLAFIAILGIAAIKAAPSFVRSYIEDHSQEFIGRDIKISDISLSLSTFTLSIDSLTVYEKDGQTPFVSFDEFRIDANPTHLLAKEISISEIYLKGLYARVIQNGSVFNFSDILEFLNAKNTSSTEPLPQASIPQDSAKQDSVLSLNTTISNALHGLSLAIDNITIENSNVIYEDRKVGSNFKLKDFSLRIPSVYFSNQDTDIGVALRFEDGGNLDVKVLFNMETENFNVLVGLHQFKLACAKPYLKDFINYKDFSGALNVDLDLSGNVNAPLASNIKGHLTLEDLLLTETSDKTIGIKLIEAGLAKANLDEMDIKVDSLIVDGVNAHFDLFKNGNNIQTLLNPKSETASDTTDMIQAAVDSVAISDTTAKDEPKNNSKPLKLMVNKVLVKNTDFTANDMTLKKQFSYKVSNITVVGNNINLNTPCAINVSANFPDGGTLNVKYTGAFSDLGTMDAYVSVKNLALKHFTPYSHHFTGYPISAGTLAFASDNKIKNYELDSRNTIDIYNISVDDKDPNTDPEFMVPMKVGLYILKDKDDKIQFDVPVKGNLNDPEFSYGKIIWKTVMNLLIKVAVSPLRLVGNLASSGANALGFDLGKNDEITIDPLNSTLESELFAKAQKMIDVITADPKLKLTFVQNFNIKNTTEEYRVRKLKTEFYKASQNKKTLNELDEKAIIAIDDKDSLYAAFAAQHSKDYSKTALEKEILDKANKRNQDLLNFLQKQNGVDKKNVKVITAPRKDLVKHKGKSMYKIQLDVK